MDDGTAPWRSSFLGRRRQKKTASRAFRRLIVKQRVAIRRLGHAYQFNIAIGSFAGLAVLRLPQKKQAKRGRGGAAGVTGMRSPSMKRGNISNAAAVRNSFDQFCIGEGRT